MHHVTTLLSTNQYVRVIALDFSKAFDTVRHSCIASKLAQLPLPDNIYNWFVAYFTEHNHATSFGDAISDLLSINASVFQGSALGPPLFIINSTDLKPQFDCNYMDKYADDSYLIVGSNNELTI